MDLKEAEKLLFELDEKATPGPWEAWDSSWCSGAQSLVRIRKPARRWIGYWLHVLGIGNYDDEPEDGSSPWQDTIFEDRDLTVHLRNHAPDIIRAKNAQLEKLTEALRVIDRTLQIPAAEYVPAIGDVFKIIDKALKSWEESK